MNKWSENISIRYQEKDDEFNDQLNPGLVCDATLNNVIFCFFEVLIESGFPANAVRLSS